MFWYEMLVRQTFLPCDADIIMDIRFCNTWPRDKLIWHYNSHDIFTVHSTYHMLLGDAHLNGGDGDVLLAGAKHGRRPASAVVEKACSCLHGLRCAYDFGASNIIIEGDSLTLIQVLQASITHDNVIGLLVCSILSFIEKFDFFSWYFVKRGGNKVTHDLAHWQPLCLEGKLWESDTSESVLSRALDDMHDFLTSNLI
ncbi:hypothetical protein Cgig2_015901 [Carnegiea gigantea]|uniref:RNase H type-1 domain-containing protein n=1 Tax=Carnegiea gigantea TaxID=171969 RepID=A0A9Q1JM58_9CARY|nr:hypothetical protein Cgig2_015901 [Carnegiea gigantea]